MKKALPLCKECLRRQPDNTEALQLLARLHLHRAEWQPAIDALKKHALLEDDPASVFDLTHRIGEIYQDKLGRMDRGARTVFEALFEKQTGRPVHPRTAGVHLRGSKTTCKPWKKRC